MTGTLEPRRETLVRPATRPRKAARRALAFFLGVLVAGFLAATWAVLYFPRLWTEVQPGWIRRWLYGATVALEDPGSDCLGVPGSLQIRSEGSGERVDPLVRDTIEADGRVLRSEYSAHWAETRVVEFFLWSRSVRVRADFETDCGTFPGSIVADESHVRRAGDELCFDLVLRRMDGSSIRERWIGSALVR